MWEELAAGHALRALEPEDEALFLDHLPGCDACARTRDEMTGVASHLAYAAEPADPPEALKRSILDAVRATGPAAGSGPVVPRQTRRPDVPTLITARRPAAAASRRPAGAVLALAASLVLVVGLAVWNANLRSNVAVKDQAIARLSQVEELAADPSTVRVAMTSGSGARGTAYLRGSEGVVLLQGLPANSRDSIYVLWYEDRGGAYHAVDAFDVVDDDRVNAVEVAFGRPVGEIVRVAVSKEPGRTMPTKPSFPLVHGPIKA